MSQPKLHGFTLLRNGLKYDYPFRESLHSLSALCDSVVVAVGKSEDGTEEALRAFDIVQIPTIWDESKRQGGTILSEQTNIALEALRSAHPKGWGFYLQADEVISERDFEQIKRDLEQAEKEGCDCISFRYLHFWQSFEKIAVGKRWYPQEIRAIRLDSKIESYGDAQSFRGWTKRFESDATIYHYGHVREAAAYEKKKKDFHRWWHGDGEIAQVIAKGEKGDQNEETLTYLGPHPKVMKERIEKQSSQAFSEKKKQVLVLGDKEKYSREFLASLHANTLWTLDEKSVLRLDPNSVVLLEKLSLVSKLLAFGKFGTKIPAKMGSPQAREWTPEFQALLRFSEKGIRAD